MKNTKPKGMAQIEESDQRSTIAFDFSNAKLRANQNNRTKNNGTHSKTTNTARTPLEKG
jgi:hypothetical protein